MPHALIRALRWLDLLVEWVVVALMVALVGIVALQFIDRHFIDTGIAAKDTWRMLRDQTGLVAIPVLAAALALLPWRKTPPAHKYGAILVAIRLPLTRASLVMR